MVEKISVLIVDDSPFKRKTLQAVLESDPSIRVLGIAENGKEGVEKALELKPDVITMDLEMPVMNGFEAIERIMKLDPIPIVAVSSMNIDTVIKTLDSGAMEYVSLSGEIGEVSEDLLRKVKIASRVKALRHMGHSVRRGPAAVDEERARFKVVAIGISTGGPQALKVLFQGIPSNFPAGILVVQHMTPGFMDGMIEWLKICASIDIRVPKIGDLLQGGTAFIAPDACHMEVTGGSRIYLRKDVDETTLHVPSIDVMMRSVAEVFRDNTIGVIMTGMGKDGVEGLKAIKEVGGTTIAQDESSSAIFGMNRAAIEAGIVDKVVPVDKIAGEIVAALYDER